MFLQQNEKYVFFVRWVDQVGPWWDFPPPLTSCPEQRDMETCPPARGAARSDARDDRGDEGGRPEDHGGRGGRDGAEVAPMFQKNITAE